MKYLLFLFPALIVAGTYWTPLSATKEGFSVEHTCKKGVQIVIFTKGKQSFEQPYCYNRSTWDGDCLHPPIRCYTEDIKDNQ